MTVPRERADEPAWHWAIPSHQDPVRTPELLGTDSVLYSLLRGIASTSGEPCFRAIARNLAQALGTKYAIVAEHLPERAAVRSLAFWAGDRFRDDVEWPLSGTPCERVIEGEVCHVPDGLQQAFPRDEALVGLGAESYLGVPMHDDGGAVIGHLFVMDTRAMPALPRNLAVFRIFAARAATEVMRMRVTAALAISEQRFRAVVDSALDAILAVDSDLRVVIFNSAAERTFGCRGATAVGQPVARFLGRRLAEQLEAHRAASNRAGAARLHALAPGMTARRVDGEEFPVEGTLSRADGAQKPLFTLTLRDVSERDRARARLDELHRENAWLREQAAAVRAPGDIVGRSPAILKVQNDIDRVAGADSIVLIQGETGTGKELIARAIHERSARRDGPFVKVNCAALPVGLVESEFFGHEKGAFTGAASARRGRFELAHGGTIFLDEVGDVAPDVQVKLLRVLQESEFERVGGSQTIRVDVRVIAATNRDLEADVRAQRFRADLYYRLSVFPIAAPPLRDRLSDVPLLASYFVTQLAAAVGKRIECIEDASMQRLMAYPWPGNIRELRNVLERAVILCDGPELRIEDGELRRTPAAAAAAPLVLADMERAHILAVLQQTGGAIAGARGAARILGIPPSTLRSRMAKLGIKV